MYSVLGTEQLFSRLIDFRFAETVVPFSQTLLQLGNVSCDFFALDSELVEFFCLESF